MRVWSMRLSRVIPWQPASRSCDVSSPRSVRSTLARDRDDKIATFKSSGASFDELIAKSAKRGVGGPHAPAGGGEGAA